MGLTDYAAGSNDSDERRSSSRPVSDQLIAAIAVPDTTRLKGEFDTAGLRVMDVRPREELKTIFYGVLECSGTGRFSRSALSSKSGAREPRLRVGFQRCGRRHWRPGGNA